MGVESIFLAPSPQAGADILLETGLTAESVLALSALSDTAGFTTATDEITFDLATTRRVAQYIAQIPADIWNRYRFLMGAASLGRSISSHPRGTLRFAPAESLANIFAPRPVQRLAPDGRVVVAMEASGRKTRDAVTALAVPDASLPATQGGLFQPSRRSAILLNMVLRKGREKVDNVHTILTGTIPFREQPVEGWSEAERKEFALQILNEELKGFTQRRRMGILPYGPVFLFDPRDDDANAVIPRLERIVSAIAGGSDERQLTLVYVHALGMENGFQTHNNGMLDPTTAPVTTISYPDLFRRLDTVPGKKVLILNLFLHQADAVRHLKQWPRRGDYALVTTKEPSNIKDCVDGDLVFSPSSLATVLKRGTPLSRFQTRWPQNELKLELLLGFDVIP